MSTKTPGQIAYEANQGVTDWLSPDPQPMPWGDLEPEFQQPWEASASAVIEMCAEIADAHKPEASLADWTWQSGYEAARANIAHELRSLKRPPVDGCQAEPAMEE